MSSDIRVFVCVQARSQIAETLGAAKPMTIGAIGFLVMIIASIFTSTSSGESLGQAVDVFLNWYVPLFALALLIRTEADFFKLVRVIGWCTIFVALAGVLEFILQRRIFIDVMPASLKAALMQANPSFANMVTTSSSRMGMYRASSIFGVPLSFGEFAAIVAPFGFATFMHSETARGRIFGLVIVISSVAAIFVSGARGGYVSFLVASAAFAALWTLRQGRFKEHSLIPAAAGAIFVVGFSILVALIFVWPRLHAMVLGGPAEEASNQARIIEWHMAIPHILSNPVTGHGFGTGAYVVGYYTRPDAPPTLDSYLISLLVETGVPGFVFFFLIVGAAIWLGAKEYLTDRSSLGALAGGFACAIVAFAVYRTVLSQHENHTLFFLFVGALMVLAKLKKDRDALREDDGSSRRNPRPRFGRGQATTSTRSSSLHEVSI